MGEDIYIECKEKYYPCDKQNKHEDKHEGKKEEKRHDKKHGKSQTESQLQTHNHEFLGSTKLAEEEEERHNHRFAGVSSEEIPVKHDRHIHAILTPTDFFDHHHEIGVRTGIDIDVGNDKHVHFACGTTTLNDGHVHEFQFATLIDSPLTPVNDIS